MIRYIHRDPGFEKCLDLLRNKGGAALFAAKKAEEIITKIMIMGGENSHRVARLTSKGELRIKCCIKYDLGSGYRLVCAKKGSLLSLLYIGSHDDCDRWLERNKGFQYATDNDGNTKLVMQEASPIDFESIGTNDPADEYEDQLMKSIDDKVLRTIFCGLVDK
jgi:hypothetical protein